MDQKTQPKIEFFELCRLLNKSNLKANQKTEILFFIEADNQKLTLYATTNRRYKIQLIISEKKSIWATCNCSGLNNLENELVQFFKIRSLEKLPDIELTKMIKLFIFQQVS